MATDQSQQHAQESTSPPGELAESVQLLMGPDGPLARADEGYRLREQQLEMALAVAGAIEEQAALIVEAGTGVGKTYAYLVPLLLSGRRGLVSTATKSLQDQLFNRDLPRLCDRLGVPISTALLKGRGSYLCRHRLTQARTRPEGLDRFGLRLLSRVEEWARRTATGDLSEVQGLDERSSLMPLVTSTRDNCLGSECPSFNECHVVQARRQAMTADLVVVNHHLFFADLSLKEGGMAELLPSVDVVVFDEAHQILDTGLQFVATSLSTLSVIDLARDLLAAGIQHARGLQDWPARAQSLERSARDLAIAADGQERPQPRGQRRVRWSERASGRADAAARPLEVAFEQALHGLQASLKEAQSAAAAVSETHPDLQRIRDRAAELAERAQAFQQPVAVDRVRWIDVSPHQARLIDTPLDIRELMAQSQSASPRAWICTSATLGDEPTLAWFREQSGLQNARVLSVGSPYDYPAHARVWVPGHLPEPGDATHSQAVAQMAARCASRLGGRTFVLATTLRALPVIAQGLRQIFAERGLTIEVLEQGAQTTRRELLDRFVQAADGSGAVLVGAQSFWEGIDVPGRELQCVVIDKLPFPPPDDPLLEARSRALKAQGRDPFDEIFLAETAVSLKQGAGRLIRSETDKGLLVLCDRRLLTKSYGPRLLRSLPPMPQLTDAAAVVEWIAQLRAPD